MKTNAAVNSLHSKLLIAAALLIPACWIYWEGLGYGFIEIDDGGQVYENPNVQALTLQNIWAIFTTPVVGMYQPLTTFINALLIALFGKTATALNTLGLLLHLANTVLYFLIAQHLFQDRTKGLLIALLLSVHPLMVESVMWISTLSTLWFTFFFLCAFWCYLQYIDQQALKLYALSVLYFFLGALCKVQIVPLVGVLILTDLLVRQTKSAHPTQFIKQWALEKLPFIIIAIAFLAVALFFRGGESGFPGYDYDPRLLFPAQLIWYPFKLLAPLQLGIQYDWPEHLWSLFTYLSYALMPLAVLTLWLFRHNKLFLFGSLFYLGNILLHTTPFTQFLGPYADRYAYLSSFGVWIALFSLLPSTLLNKTLWLFGLIIMGFALLAKQQRSTWQDTISVWSHNLSHQSATFSYGMRGALYFKQGLLPEAKADFQIVADNPDTRLDPAKYAYLYTQLGILVADENPEKAEDYFNKVIAYEKTAPTYGNLAMISLRLNKPEAAEQAYKTALTIDPNHLDSLNGLSNLYFTKQRFDDMIPLLSAIIELTPKDTMPLKKRAFIYAQQGNHQGAQQDVNQVIQQLKQQGLPTQDPMLMQIQRMIQTRLKP